MRKRVIAAIIVLAICLLVMLLGASFYSYFVNMLFGANLHFYLDSKGVLYMNSSTGNASGPLLALILIFSAPVAFIIAVVILMLEVRYRSKKKKQIIQSYTA